MNNSVNAKGEADLSKPNKQSFLEGAFILVMASAIVKIIGAIFKIPMTNLIGSDGMAFFTVAYNIYTAMFVLSTAGLPVAVSKMVAEANARGRFKEVKAIVRITFVMFSVIGIIGSLVIFLGAGYFVEVIGAHKDSYYAVVAIAPSIFFVAITSTIRGYYQGLSNMFPTAISQVIEASLKLFVGYGLAYALLASGQSIAVAAAGAIAGVTIGTMMSSVYLVIKLKRDRDKSINKGKVSAPSRSVRGIVSNLVRIAIPVTVGASVLSLTNLIDMAVVLNRLQDTIFTEDQAMSLYGIYQLPLTVFNLPQTLITAISISIIPAIASAFAKGNKNLGHRTIESATKMVTMLAFPCAVGLHVLAYPILDLLYYTQAEEIPLAADLLEILSFAVLFVAMVSLTNAILQSIGRADVPVTHMFIGGIVKLSANYILVGIPDINIYGAPVGTTLCYATITILNLYSIYKINGSLPAFVPTVVKPLIAAAGMGVTAILSFNLFSAFLGDKIGVLMAIAVAAVVYAVLLVVVGAITKEDAKLMPKGEKIIKILKLK